MNFYSDKIINDIIDNKPIENIIEIIETFIENNTIVNYSRDECKHWKMSLKYKTTNLSFIIGDIRDYGKVENAILREQPNIIIIMAALKHIDRCEYAIEECVKTNLNGPLNVLNSIESNNDRLTSLETVIFISTDKACEPTNVYGMAKALAESAIVEKSLYIKKIKFVNVRYGNVLNSRGSIIPILHEKGIDPNIHEFSLTHRDMTRFVMTLEQSVALIEHAINKAESGDIVIPKLISLNEQFFIISKSNIDKINSKQPRFEEHKHCSYKRSEPNRRNESTNN
jgi:FlaA1/EpsC-like NDP-sugar epimerase